MIRIGLDASLLPGPAAGGGTYVFELANALRRIDAVNAYTIYPVFYHIVHPDFSAARFPQANNMRVAYQAWPGPAVRILWHRAAPDAVKEWLLGPVDVVHSTTFCAPRLRWRRARLVVTVYDLSFLVHPELHEAENVAHCLRGTREALDRADAIIAISEFTRRELVERLGAPAGRIAVTRLAARPGLGRVEEPARLAEVRRRYGLPERFFLFLGALEPRKNLVRLLEAFRLLPAAHRMDCPLVVSGAPGWREDAVHETVRKLDLERQVHFVGYIAAEDLAAVYSLAHVVVYPSLYEGFGLPVLEGMACGTPVLAANGGAIPEVAGDAAVLVRPTDVHALAEGLERLSSDVELRGRLREAGPRRAAEFSWDRCAAETLAVYRALTTQGAPC